MKFIENFVVFCIVLQLAILIVGGYFLLNDLNLLNRSESEVDRAILIKLQPTPIPTIITATPSVTKGVLNGAATKSGVLR